MNVQKRQVATWLTNLLLAASALVSAAEPNVTVSPVEQWSTVFGETETTFHFDVASQEPFAGHVGWRHSAKGRTIARGEQPIAVAKGQPARAAVRLQIPAVKDGIVFETDLDVAVFAEKQDQPLAEQRKPVRIFARDPFLDRKRWLDELQLLVFDPAGETVALFEKANIPHRRTRNAAAIEAAEKAVVIVGEGVSLNEQRVLAEVLFAAAAKGTPVLWLAPSAGRCSLPGTDADPGAAPRSMSFRRGDVIAELDERLDSLGWPPDGQLAASELAIKNDRGRTVAEVVEPKQGWPWLEVDYPRPGRKLIWCGFAVIQRWDDGPTPRYLFARMLERLTKSE